MKIALEGTVLQKPFTGIARSTLTLYSHCVSLRPSLEIIGFQSKQPAQAVPPFLKVFRFGSLLSPRMWKHLGIPWQCARLKPDLIHFPWNGNIPRLFSNTPVVSTINDTLPLVIPNYFPSPGALKRYRTKIQADLDRSDLVVTISQYSKNELIKHFTLKKDPLVIHLGSTLCHEPSSGDIPLEGEGNFFLYAGGYDARKGLVPLLRTFIELHRKKKISSRLILTGTQIYFSPEFKLLLEEGRRMNILKELGYVPDQVLTTLFKQAKALIYPSCYEGFGLPPLESMSLGCPVITTRYTSIPEICGEGAIYIEPEDQNNFSEAIIALEQDKNLRDQLKTKGLSQAAKFSWDRSARIYLDAIDSLTGRGHES
jgi:glycosyltransferase involved in cell wall biosynthesis